MSSHKHIFIRNGVYYFRISIPTKLRYRFKANELCYSLSTKSIHKAKVKCYALTTLAHHIFDMVGEMGELTPQQIKDISRKYFKECLSRFDEYKSSHEANRMALPSSSYEDHPDSINLDQAVAQVVAPYVSDVDKINTGSYLFDMNNHVITQQDITGITDTSYSYKALARGMERIRDEFKNILIQHKNYALDYNINDELFTDLFQPKNRESNKPDVTTTDNLTSSIFDAYINECNNTLEDKTVKMKQSIFSLWVGVNGDLPIQQTSKAHGRAFKDALTRLPSNATTRYKNKSVQELISLNDPKKMSVKTINKHLINMSAFFKWATQQGYTQPASPVEGLAIKERNDARNDRLSFSTDQLSKLFLSPIYKGSASEGRRLVSGDMVVKDSLYWIPLIGLFTGLRLQEICQLHTADIKQVNDIWVFDINADGEFKKLKTSQSKRLIPIHSQIISAGWITYVQTKQSEGSERLFTDILPSSDGSLSGSFSKRFSRALSTLDIKTDKTSFHSFRHSFIDALRNADTQDSLIRQYCHF